MVDPDMVNYSKFGSNYALLRHRCNLLEDELQYIHIHSIYIYFFFYTTNKVGSHDSETKASHEAPKCPRAHIMYIYQ